MGGLRASMLKHPNSHATGFLFMKPFTCQVWLALLFLWFLYAFFLYYVSFLYSKAKEFRPRGNQKEKTQDKDTKEVDNEKITEETYSISQGLYHFSLGAMQYGSDINPTMLSGKILQVSWSCFAMIMISMYTANLAAIFSANAYHRPLGAIEDILQSGRNIFTRSVMEEYLLGVDKNDILISLIDENRLNFSLKVTHWKNSDATISEIKTELESGKIWIDFDALMESSSHHIDHMYLLDGYFTRIGFGFAMRKDWKWIDQVKRKFSDYGQSGYFDQLARKYQRKQNAGTKITNEVTILGLLEVLGTVLLAGIVAALLQTASFLSHRARMSSISSVF